MQRGFDVDVEDTPFDPGGKRLKGGKRAVRYREVKGATLYEVTIRLVGNDVPFVRSVTYHLHETFKPPHHTVSRTHANPDCSVKLWMWGVFELEAVVTDLRGNEHRIYHHMQFDSYFEPEIFEAHGLETERA